MSNSRRTPELEALAHELKRAVAGEVRFDAGTRAVYSADASNYRQLPIGVVLPRTLEDVVAALNQFFRISRRYLVNLDGIQDIIHYTNSRLEIKMEHYKEEQIIVARERVSEFKAWLDR